MIPAPHRFIALAALGSAVLLGAAFGYQYAGYPPCELCILQRWPHAVAIAIGIAALATRRHLRPRPFAALGMLAMLVCAVIAFYHGGVELKWWPGPAACTGGAADIAGMSIDDLMKKIEAAPVVRCDQPALLILGLSMAMWNAIGSLSLAGIWAAGLRRAR